MSKPKSVKGLGFRSVCDFNLAMLASQGWLLLINQNSLVVRVLKACYFHNKTLMDVDLGVNPNYTWQSIHGGLKVLKKGCVYRVGDGFTIIVWQDPWIKSLDNFVPSLCRRLVWRICWL